MHKTIWIITQIPQIPHLSTSRENEKKHQLLKNFLSQWLTFKTFYFRSLWPSQIFPPPKKNFIPPGSLTVRPWRYKQSQKGEACLPKRHGLQGARILRQFPSTPREHTPDPQVANYEILPFFVFLGYHWGGMFSRGLLEFSYLDVPSKLVKGQDQWVITPIYPIYK